MTVRRSLLVGALLFAASWILPGLIAMGLISGISPLARGWGGLEVLGGGLLIGAWARGMLLGASVLVPLSTWFQSRHPNLPARRVLPVGLIVWAIFAGFLVQVVNVTAPTLLPGRDCRADVRITELKVDTDAAGRRWVRGRVRNAGRSVLTHLELAIDGELRRATPVVCWPLREGGASAGPETEIMPGWPLEFGCPVDVSAEAMQCPKATINEAACKTRSW